MQRLRAAEHGGQRLERGAHDVVLRLLRGERRAAGLRVEAQHPAPAGRSAPKRSRMIRAHMRRAARNFATSSKKCMWQAKKNDRRGANSSMSQPRVERCLHVGDAVGERERDLLRGGRAGLAHVVAADRDRVPPRHPLAAVREQVGDQSHRRPGRVDVGASRRVLLEDVVLHGAADVRGADPVLLGHQLVEQQQDRRRRVDRHRSRDSVERDALEQPCHVLDRVDRDARLADLALGARMVGVEAHLGRQVEGDADSPSARGPAGSGTARSSPRRSPCLRTGASSTAGLGTSSGYTPRVKGYSPGCPRSRSASNPLAARSSAV